MKTETCYWTEGGVHRGGQGAYRQRLGGGWPPIKAVVLRFSIALLLLGVAGCRSDRSEAGRLPDNFRVVTEAAGVYRSAQPDRAAFETLADRGFRSVLNLRRHHADADLLAGLPLREYRLPVNAGDFTEEQLLQAVRLLQQAEPPVLIHCWHGSDRTGTVAAAFRIAVQGWTVEAAIDEMLRPEFGHHRNVYRNLPELLRRIDWPEFRRKLAEPVPPAA